jgi:hypothetical protein
MTQVKRPGHPVQLSIHAAGHRVGRPAVRVWDAKFGAKIIVVGHLVPLYLVSTSR